MSNKLITSDWLVKDMMASLKNNLGISMRMVKDWDLAAEDPTPSFDHIESEMGRKAAKKLWRGAFGDPKPIGFVNRMDVLYGVGTVRPDLAVKVTG